MRTRDVNKEAAVKKEAVKLLAKDGFEGFSMNKLANACGISVATLYIYYEDKDDLIKKLGVEIGEKFFNETIKDYSPKMSFKEVLRKQWENRARFGLKYPDEVACYEIILHSTHGEYVFAHTTGKYTNAMKSFFMNAYERNELSPASTEVFWAVAYGPLYTLLRFHTEGKAIGGKPFKLTNKIMDEAFELTLKALTP